jgi:hypothetical protein
VLLLKAGAQSDALIVVDPAAPLQHEVCQFENSSTQAKEWQSEG